MLATIALGAAQSPIGTLCCLYILLLLPCLPFLLLLLRMSLLLLSPCRYSPALHLYVAVAMICLCIYTLYLLCVHGVFYRFSTSLLSTLAHVRRSNACLQLSHAYKCQCIHINTQKAAGHQVYILTLGKLESYTLKQIKISSDHCMYALLNELCLFGAEQQLPIQMVAWLQVWQQEQFLAMQLQPPLLLLVALLRLNTFPKRR